MSNNGTKITLAPVSKFGIIVSLSGIFIFSRGIFSFLMGGYSNFLVLLGFLTPLLFINSRNFQYRINWDRALSLLVAYILYVLFSSLQVETPFRGLVGVGLLLFYFVFFLNILVVNFSRRDLILGIQQSMYVFTIYLSFWCTYEILFDQPISVFRQFSNPPPMDSIYAPFRISSSIGSTLPFGVVMSYISIYWFSIFVFEHKIRHLFLFLCCSFLLMGTFSRGAQGMLIIGTLVILLFRFLVGVNRATPGLLGIKGVCYLLISTIALYLLALILLPPALFSRIKNIFNWSTEVSNFNRVKTWMRSLENINGYTEWLFGKSIGSSGNVLSYFSLNSKSGGLVTESYFIKLLLEVGIIGTIIFYLMIGFFIKNNIIHYYKSRSVREKQILSFLIAVLMAHTIELFFLQSLESTAVAFVFMVAISLSYKLCIKEVPSCH